MSDPRPLIIAAVSGVMFAAGLIYSTGYRGTVAGFDIGPSASLLRVAGR